MRIRVTLGARASGGLRRGLGEAFPRKAPRLAAGHSDLRPVIVIGSQGVLHVEGGNLPAARSRPGIPIGADQKPRSGKEVASLIASKPKPPHPTSVNFHSLDFNFNVKQSSSKGGSR